MTYVSGSVKCIIARGALFAERRNRGYTLYDARSGGACGTPASDRKRRQVRSPLLVALERTMGLHGSFWTHRLQQFSFCQYDEL
jgi:hypothetical protein